MMCWSLLLRIVVDGFVHPLAEAHVRLVVRDGFSLVEQEGKAIERLYCI